MKSEEHEFLVKLYAREFEREMMSYVKSGYSNSAEGWLQFLKSLDLPRPVFDSESDLAAFYRGILSNVILQMMNAGLTRLLHNGSSENTVVAAATVRPPLNAEYVLHLLLRKDERDAVIGDLIEDYGKLLERFSKRRADIWFYKQVAGSVLALLRRALLKIGALIWLGRILRRLVS